MVLDGDRVAVRQQLRLLRHGDEHDPRRPLELELHDEQLARRPVLLHRVSLCTGLPARPVGARSPRSNEAEEVVQESLLNVWHKAHTYNPKNASVNTWLFTIVRNKRIDFVRKERPDLVVSDDLWPVTEQEKHADQSQKLDDQYESDLNAKVIRTLISELPEEQRQIVFKVYFEGKSHSEIAAELELPLGTIKSRLRLAMKKLDTLAKQNISWLIIIHLMTF